MSAWVRRLGWRARIANALAKVRRNPSMNGGKARQETVYVRGPKGMRERTSGVEQAEKDKTGNRSGKKAKKKRE